MERECKACTLQQAEQCKVLNTARGWKRLQRGLQEVTMSGKERRREGFARQIQAEQMPTAAGMVCHLLRHAGGHLTCLWVLANIPTIQLMAPV